MIYLASPYTHREKIIEHFRFQKSCEIASWFFNQGVFVFSPLAHCHPMATMYSIPTTWEFWAQYDREMISYCKALVILKLPGWENSVGVKAEKEIARELGIRVHEIDPSRTMDLHEIVSLYGERRTQV